MTKEELLNLKEKLSGLQEEQELDRDLYLRNIANGTPNFTLAFIM